MVKYTATRKVLSVYHLARRYGGTILSIAGNPQGFLMMIKLNRKARKRDLMVFGEALSHYFLNYEPIYERIKNEYDIYFMRQRTDRFNYYEYLLAKGIDKNKIILSCYGKFIKWKVYINAGLDRDIPSNLSGVTRIQLYHGTGVSTFAKNDRIEENSRSIEALRKFDIHFMIGPQYKKAVYSLRDNVEAFEIGHPKLDRLFNKSYDHGKILNKIHFPQKRPIVIYAPHYLHCLSLKRFGKRIIENLVAADVNVIVKLHEYILVAQRDDRWDKWLMEMEKQHANLHFAREHDSTLYYPVADAMVTDVATSAGFEFIMCNKPLIIINSEEWYKRQGTNDCDMERDIERASIVINSPDELHTALKYSLANPNEKSKIREEIFRKYYYNVGHATDAAVKAIRKVMNS